jgi:hypothetical protein
MVFAPLVTVSTAYPKGSKVLRIPRVRVFQNPHRSSFRWLQDDPRALAYSHRAPPKLGLSFILPLLIRASFARLWLHSVLFASQLIAIR